jgi:hypothetical protein
VASKKDWKKSVSSHVKSRHVTSSSSAAVNPALLYKATHTRLSSLPSQTGSRFFVFWFYLFFIYFLNLVIFRWIGRDCRDAGAIGSASISSAPCHISSRRQLSSLSTHALSRWKHVFLKRR